MTQEQLNKIEYSFSNSDSFVFTIGNAVYVADEVLKHSKEATIEMIGCSKIDESCFESSGDYYGDICSGPLLTIILNDPYADSNCTVASKYYDDEIVAIEEE